jgi:hypothetical protein
MAPAPIGVQIKRKEGKFRILLLKFSSREHIPAPTNKRKIEPLEPIIVKVIAKRIAP